MGMDMHAKSKGSLMYDSARDLLEEIEAFLLSSGLSATAFGREVSNDNHLVHRLRRGHSVTSKTIDACRTFMYSNKVGGRKKINERSN